MNPILPTLPTRSSDRLNQLLEEMLPSRWAFDTWSPAVDIVEAENAYRIMMDLPGLHREDIDVEVARDVITIQGKLVENRKVEHENYVRRERRMGEFRRSFKLDAPVRADQVTAEFKDGTLIVVVPKIEPVAPQKIQVKT